MKLFFVFVAAAGLSWTIIAPARAGTWNEVGDAGGTLATAQATAGSGSLTAINGTFLSGNDIDVFSISITDKSIFRAAITSQGSDSDPDIWLFDLNGFGISMDSTVNSGETLVTGNFVPANGTYYLAISSSGFDAVSSAGDIWTFPQATRGERAPNGPGAAQPFLNWTGSGTITKTSYTVSLQGAGFSIVPEPAINLLLFIGAIPLYLMIQRRRGLRP